MNLLILVGAFYIDCSSKGSPNLISGESYGHPRYIKIKITRREPIQNTLNLVKDVRGCMTRFDPLTPEIVAEQSEDDLIYEELKEALSHCGMDINKVVFDGSQSYQNAFSPTASKSFRSGVISILILTMPTAYGNRRYSTMSAYMRPRLNCRSLMRVLPSFITLPFTRISNKIISLNGIFFNDDNLEHIAEGIVAHWGKKQDGDMDLQL